MDMAAFSFEELERIVEEGTKELSRRSNETTERNAEKLEKTIREISAFNRIQILDGDFGTDIKNKKITYSGRTIFINL